MAGNVAQIRLAHLDLRIDDGPGPQLAQNSPEILFRGAVAIIRSVVEVVDAELQRAPDDVALLGVAATHHEAGVAAAAESDFRDVQAGIARRSVPHGAGLLGRART